jgi:nucleosome binding factor SPN SPT16 subunit
MSDDLVNRITLDYLISKQQLQKLNKHIKQKETDTLRTDRELYNERISELFTKMMKDEMPDNLLQEVKNSFSYFIEKSIYYLKMTDQVNSEEAVVEEVVLEEHSAEHSETEEATVASLEDDNEDEEEEDDEDEEDSTEHSEEDEEEEDVTNVKPQKVFNKKPKQTHSEGVEEIQHLPLDWFTKVRCNYKQKQIIQRKK